MLIYFFFSRGLDGVGREAHTAGPNEAQSGSPLFRFLPNPIRPSVGPLARGDEGRPLLLFRKRPPPPAPPPACRDPGRSLPPISSINSPPRVRIDFLLSVSIAARIDRDLGAGFVLFHHDFSLMLVCMSIDPELEWPAASRSRSSPPGCRDRRAASALARLLLLGPPLRSSSSPVPRYVRDSVARPTNWGGFFLEFLLSPLLVMDEISEFFLGDEHLP